MNHTEVNHVVFVLLNRDTIKLCAQFTACIGKSFMRQIIREERDNETFAFLSPAHPRFQYFLRLVDAYKHILEQHDDYEDYKSRRSRNTDPDSQHFLGEFKALHLSRDRVFSKVLGHVEYEQREKRKQQENLDFEEGERSLVLSS